MSQLVLKCQARHVEGEAKIHLETQRVSITTTMFVSKSSKSEPHGSDTTTLHGLYTQAGVCYQAKPGGLSGTTDLLSPGGL